MDYISKLKKELERAILIGDIEKQMKYQTNYLKHREAGMLTL